MRRHELTDEQWQVIQPLLPASDAKGRPRVDDRRVINGMLSKAKTGVAWRDLPERYGPWKTVYNRTPPALAVSRCLTQRASGFCGGQSEPGDHPIGRSPGGPTTKIHLACDGHGRPLSAELTGGNVNDCTMFTQVTAEIKFRRPGRGRPPTRPSRVLADKGYSSRAIRCYLRRRHIPATIPERRDQQANRLRRGRAGGRPPVFDRTA